METGALECVLLWACRELLHLVNTDIPRNDSRLGEDGSLNSRSSFYRWLGNRNLNELNDYAFASTMLITCRVHWLNTTYNLIILMDAEA